MTWYQLLRCLFRFRTLASAQKHHAGKTRTPRLQRLRRRPARGPLKTNSWHSSMLYNARVPGYGTKRTSCGVKLMRIQPRKSPLRGRWKLANVVICRRELFEPSAVVVWVVLYKRYLHLSFNPVAYFWLDVDSSIYSKKGKPVIQFRFKNKKKFILIHFRLRSERDALLARAAELEASACVSPALPTPIRRPLGRLDSVLDTPSRPPRVPTPCSSKFAAILTESNPIELQRQLLTSTVQNQVCHKL